LASGETITFEWIKGRCKSCTYALNE